MSRYPSAPTLARLKDFQRRTVDYVFRRLYLDKPPARRFLVADEVGLGKTLVAKGVIARALEHLDGRVKRIDVVYICSNAAIAQQNVGRLNVLGQGDFSLASRLTLLPTQVGDLRRNPVNFVSFTPGTTFDLKSRGGVMLERSVLYRMLADEPWLDNSGLLNALQVTAGRDSWKSAARAWRYPLDPGLCEAFRHEVRGDPVLRDRIADTTQRFHRHREGIGWPERSACYALIGDLRQRLAAVCLEELEPDLIILDEFQRFRNLLDPTNPTAELAQQLFNYPDARVLLLSATPYKMLSLDHEAEDDHYPDFLKTVAFLMGGDAAVDELRSEIRAFRQALLDLGPDRRAQATRARGRLQERLLSVMCRTERVAHSARQDAMLMEPPRPSPLAPNDIQHAALLDRVSHAVGARDAIEYWKSAPYALNFMKTYDLRRKLEGLGAEGQASVAQEVAGARARLLDRRSLDTYQPVDLPNARLRSLAADTLGHGLWRVLWLSPSLPYWRPEGPFIEVVGCTKSLVFSSWNVVPDAIAALLSYDAERRVVSELDQGIQQSELYDRLKPLLKFSRDPDGRLTGMSALLLLYPSPALASLIDPLEVALEIGRGAEPGLGPIQAAVQSRVEAALRPWIEGASQSGREDERWYWAAPALLDACSWPAALEWLATPGAWPQEERRLDPETTTALREHLDLLVQAGRGRSSPPLGRPPADLARVLAEVALAAPGVVALRALHRIAVDLPWTAPDLLASAVRIAEGFRTLFNSPESIALLRGPNAEDRYWRLALRHGLEGNLPALLDEQVHLLPESEGLADATACARVKGVAEALADSLSIRSSILAPDEIIPHPRLGTIEMRPVRLRCRFALRLGELKDEKTEARLETVRSAFNSPFRPFILASTSVGQEGLDFHTWCHAVVHWNLPSNPVDLEQREGRVHRYKGHAIRKNVAQDLGLDALRRAWQPGTDPWATLFVLARERRSDDLLAYWLYELEDGARVERRVPLLPLSREVEQLDRLKRGLALYRLVFGQPRQEDLLAHLAEHVRPEDTERVVAEWRIDLTPPQIEHGTS